MSSLGQSITPGASGIISSNEYDNDNNLSQSSKLTSIGDNNINKLIKKSGGGISAKEILKNPGIYILLYYNYLIYLILMEFNLFFSTCKNVSSCS